MRLIPLSSLLAFTVACGPTGGLGEPCRAARPTSDAELACMYCFSEDPRDSFCTKTCKVDSDCGGTSRCKGGSACAGQLYCTRQ